MLSLRCASLSAPGCRAPAFLRLVRGPGRVARGRSGFGARTLLHSGFRIRASCLLAFADRRLLAFGERSLARHRRPRGPRFTGFIPLPLHFFEELPLLLIQGDILAYLRLERLVEREGERVLLA